MGLRFLILLSFLPSFLHAAFCPRTILLASDDPKRVLELVGVNSGHAAPNCINGALASYYPETGLRHVCEAEGGYLLERDFELLGEQTNGPHFNLEGLQIGDVLSFDRMAHLGYYLGDGTIFALPCWGTQYSYGTFEVAKAHTGIKPPPGGDPLERFSILYSTEQPHTHLNVYRFRGHQRNKTPDMVATRVAGWLPVLRATNEIFLHRLEYNPQSYLPLSKLVIDTAKHIRRIWSKQIPRLNRESDALWGSEFIEELAKLQSLDDAYEAFIRQRYLSSVYMTYAKYEKEYDAQLCPNAAHQEDVRIISAIAKALGIESLDANAVLNMAAQRFRARERVSALELLPDARGLTEFP
jgi:hypothetical protein